MARRRLPRCQRVPKWTTYNAATGDHVRGTRRETRRWMTKNDQMHKRWRREGVDMPY